MKNNMWKKGIVLGIITLFVGASVTPSISGNTEKMNSAINVRVDTRDVVLSFDSPGPETWGLAWDGSYLWNADISTGKIYKLDPSDGTVVYSFDSPGPGPAGLAWDGGYLWNSEICLHPFRTYKINSLDGSLVGEIIYPGVGCPYGLAWDSGYLWHSDYRVNNNDDLILKINSSDGSIVDSFSSPGTIPKGLAWDGSYLWNADISTKKIYKLDPSDGTVVYSFHSPGLGPTGLAWDGQYLWNADMLDDKIYKIDVENQPPDIPNNPNPSNGATGVDIDTDVSWSCSDPDGHSLTYDVYFEANDPTPDVLVSDDQTETTFDPGTLDYETTYYWEIIAEDEYGSTTEGPIWHFTTEGEFESDLDCEGTLSWTGVSPSSTVKGSFTVKNIGDTGSLLDWEIDEYPEWGYWAFDPDEGDDLTSGSSVTVQVTVIAPDQPNEEFTGQVKIVNKEDASDYDTVMVTLVTPVSQPSPQSTTILYQFLQRLIQQFPILEQILSSCLLYSRMLGLQ